LTSTFIVHTSFRLPTLETNSPHTTVQTQSTVEALRTDAELAVLADEWNRLGEEAAAPNAFMSYDWFKLWARRHADEGRPGAVRPHVVVLRKEGAVSGIAPLVRRTMQRVLRVRKLGFATHHSDYNDLLVGRDDGTALRAVAEHLAQTAAEWELMDLRELRDHGSGTAGLEDALRQAGLRYQVLEESGGCPYVAMDSEAAAMIEQLRQTLRRQHRKAESEGLRIRVIEHPEREPGLVEILAALDKKKQGHRSSEIFLANYREVFQHLFDTLGPRGWLYVALLEIGGTPAAFILGFRCGRKMWDYTGSYDRAYARFSPGRLLMPPLLDYCRTNGFDEYDLLRGEEGYKLAWCKSDHRRARVVVWNRRWFSRLMAAVYLRTRVRPSLSEPHNTPNDATVE